MRQWSDLISGNDHLILITYIEESWFEAQLMQSKASTVAGGLGALFMTEPLLV